MKLIEKIKEDAKKSGQNKGKFIYFKENEKKRIRFLNDLEEGIEVNFHDSFSAGINVPCQEVFGRDCKYCEIEGLRTRTQYIWSVWDYEAKEVKLFMFPVNNCTPLPALAAIYETYGTLVDRDYILTPIGKAQNKTYTVVPSDETKFRNAKAKPFSEKAILKMLDKAFPTSSNDDDEDDDEEYENEKKKNKKKTSSSKKNNVDEDDYDEPEDDEEEKDYSELSTKELFKLCKERGIDVEPKKTSKYYINQLEKYDEAQDDWDDEDDDEWEDE